MLSRDHESVGREVVVPSPIWIKKYNSHVRPQNKLVSVRIPLDVLLRILGFYEQSTGKKRKKTKTSCGRETGSCIGQVIYASKREIY